MCAYLNSFDCWSTEKSGAVESSTERTKLTKSIYYIAHLQFALIAVGQHDHILKSHAIYLVLFKCKSPEYLFIE